MKSLNKQILSIVKSGKGQTNDKKPVLIFKGVKQAFLLAVEVPLVDNVLLPLGHAVDGGHVVDQYLLPLGDPSPQDGGIG